MCVCVIPIAERAMAQPLLHTGLSRFFCALSVCCVSLCLFCASPLSSPGPISFLSPSPTLSHFSHALSPSPTFSHLLSLSLFPSPSQHCVTAPPATDAIGVDALLLPFLEVIRSEHTTGPTTGVALAAVRKFIVYGIVGKSSVCLFSFHFFHCVSSPGLSLDLFCALLRFLLLSPLLLLLAVFNRSGSSNRCKRG